MPIINMALISAKVPRDIFYNLHVCLKMREFFTEIIGSFHAESEPNLELYLMPW